MNIEGVAIIPTRPECGALGSPLTTSAGAPYLGWRHHGRSRLIEFRRPATGTKGREEQDGAG
jgi:hypothetical protein